jgi:glycosyltransferase involved in cell wall biosynthesis
MYDRMMRRLVVASATGIVGCSWAALRHHHPRAWDLDSRMTVIRNGVSIAEFTGRDGGAEVRSELGIHPDASVFGHVGRFVWQKNHEGLIRIARRVCARRPDARFLLVGDGPLRERVAGLVRDSGLEQAVIFVGLRSDVARLLSAMDLFVLPSVMEAFGLAAVEAQVAGVPVVAADAAGIREAVAPVFHKYLRDPHDAEGFADALLELLEACRRDPSLRAQARAYGARFSIETSCAAMLAAWGVPGVEAPPDPAGWAAPARAV